MTRITRIFTDFYIVENDIYISNFYSFIICENPRYPCHPCSFETASDIFYVLQKENGKANTIQFLKELFEYVDILGVDKTIIIKALNADWKDFEDAVQGQVATENKLDFIVTRNTKDFIKITDVKILTPLEFLEINNNF